MRAMLLLPLLASSVQAQQESTPFRDSVRAASRLDTEGRHTEARAAFQRLIDGAPNAAARAQAQRRMAMSYGFVRDCANAVRYHEMVIAYWVTREAAEPQNAFYQQGEMANESARVCIDSGDLDTAERMYRRGRELGLKEPEPRTHPVSLWEYRTAHALGRLAARRGNRAEAEQHVAAARRILDSDTAMAREQERFYPYLVGYVALYTGDHPKAEAELTRALAMEGNRNDPFLHCLLGMVYEQTGRTDQAREIYRKAYDLATGHNPPAAFARPFAMAKLGVRSEGH